MCHARAPAVRPVAFAIVKRIASTGSVLALAALLTVTLGGCQAGSSAQTSQQYDPTDGRNTNLPADASWGDPYLAIRDAQVVLSGTTGSVVVTFVNKTGEEDTLESVTIDGQPAELSDAVTIADGEHAALGEGGQAVAVADGLAAAPGDWVPITLEFASSGIAEMDVLAVPPAGTA